MGNSRKSFLNGEKGRIQVETSFTDFEGLNWTFNTQSYNQFSMVKVMNPGYLPLSCGESSPSNLPLSYSDTQSLRYDSINAQNQQY